MVGIWFVVSNQMVWLSSSDIYRTGERDIRNELLWIKKWDNQFNGGFDAVSESELVKVVCIHSLDVCFTLVGIWDEEREEELRENSESFEHMRVSGDVNFSWITLST